ADWTQMKGIVLQARSEGQLLSSTDYAAMHTGRLPWTLRGSCGYQGQQSRGKRHWTRS
ncbi:hypothetical protein BCR41DRAFT_357283, partial [Lobosporangium transversale]